MTEMTKLIELLHAGNYSCVVENCYGLHTFSRRGVADLYEVYREHAEWLDHASLADKVIGKGAAALMAAGGVARVWTALISRPALQLLLDAGIPTDYDTLVPQILNRTRQGFCPVETLCMDARTPQECLPKIRAFIEQQSR